MVRLVRAALLFVCAVASIGAAHAQIIERNLPPEPPQRPSGIRLPTEQPGATDDTPLGADLRAIVLIGAKDAVTRRTVAGVQLRTAVIDADAIRERLAPFLGRPLTRKLIADIRTAIAEIYRNAGRPFVSVSTPPQEITRGVLSIRVVEARLGQITVSGASGPYEAYIRDRVRVKSGEPIDAKRLEADLDWLNRNPFRKIEAIFRPGKELGVTDLMLQVTDSRPFQASGGYSNTGTRLTDRDRWFAGATLSPFLDSVASYQVTGSRDYWINNGNVLADPATAKYSSHAARLLVPLWARSSIEIVGDYVQTNERPDASFRFRTQTTEMSSIYRTAVGNFAPGLFGDWLGGLEFKRLQRVTFFNEADVAHGNADVYQLVTGWNGHWSDATGTNDLDLRLKTNPGGGLPHNTTSDWAAFSNGHVGNIRTTLATLVFSRVTALPQSFALGTEISALWADKALPDTERIALGGAQAVRGYVTEDGAMDRALIIRNSLYLPPLSVGQSFGQKNANDRATPFVFADLGWGRDMFQQNDTTLASIGAGFEYLIGPNFRSNLTVAQALQGGAYTQSGDWRIHARATINY